jgi:hypothetical protein
LFSGRVASKKIEPAAQKTAPIPPETFVIYHFSCWLCQGKTSFGLKPCADERQITMDCSRCGVQNVVKIKGAVQNY